jgi:hypothetical protein
MQKTVSLRFILGASIALFIGAQADLTIAQSPAPLRSGTALIVPRRVVLTRTPQLVKDFPDRKTAVVRYPIVKGLENPQALQRLQSMLAVKNVFGTTLSEYREDAWLSEFDYKVGYNKNYLLDLSFTQSGMGAYPDTQTKHFIINLKTGRVITAAEAFDQRLAAKLAQLIDTKLQSEIREIVKSLASDKELSNEDRESLKSNFDDLRFKEENLDDFEVSNVGITFLFDAGFPHAIQALQPDGRYFFAFGEMKTFIKNDGPLAILVAGK